MILDYNYSEKSKKMAISYINDNGQKDFISFDGISRFKTYKYAPDGEYDTFDGAKATTCYTEKPSKFDIFEYIQELPEKYKALINNKTFPKLYTFDIETATGPNGEFSEPEDAAMPITTISVVSNTLDAIVFGTKDLDSDELDYCQRSFEDYISKNDFYKTLPISSTTPKFKYVKCSSEREMLEVFLKRIVAKVPVLAGWNSILFDWQYIVNRLKNYYPDLSINNASYTRQVKNKPYTTLTGDKVFLPMPLHTLVIDMMEVVKDDKVVMPLKESLGLDYIASETIKGSKVKYEGSLNKLYEENYKEYVFYNCIDSILVQLINYYFRSVDVYYLYSLYCTERIGSCFSKIALTEALVFKDFYERGVKIVYEPHEAPDRDKLLGAYVKEPLPGKYNFICCNDFASLYPSTIITCNISFENYVGKYYLDDELKKYIGNAAYIVIGPDVFKNKGTFDHPAIGEHIGKFVDEAALEKYRKDKDYFVSVNGHLYKNDKDYTFKRIQKTLKANRNISKYLSKKLDATVMLDIEHILKGSSAKLHTYDEQTVDALKLLGCSASKGEDFKLWSNDSLLKFKDALRSEITYYTQNEQAMKLLGNSMYGGCSHVSFYWYNMNLANDITGEARNVIHLMEKHIPEYFQEHWADMTEYHKRWGIEVDRSKIEDGLCIPIYGDSVEGNTKVLLDNGEMTIEEIFNTGEVFYNSRGKDFALSDKKVMNFDGNKFVVNRIKNVIRHKTSKDKWRICVDGNEVVVTGDHSLIVFTNKMKETKPKNVKIGDLMVTKNGIRKVDSIECIGCFNDDYVYDIEVETDDECMHNFFGNGILVHNTDSVHKDTIIHTDNGDKRIEEMFDENDEVIFKTHKGHELVKTTDKILNWRDGGLHFDKANYVMRHKVKKQKWVIKTKSGKEITVTSGHSMIVFRNGEKLEVKPNEILMTDKILCVKD